jgi:GMP synthase (glutamine-hydrolysing)
MKPFLILQHRLINEAAENELDAFLHYGELGRNEVRRVRMEENGIPHLNLDDYSAIICGGGPSNVSDPEAGKSDSQKRFETDFLELYPQIFEKDFPFLGACYGIGSLTKYAGGSVSANKYGEEVGSSIIHMTEDASSDPLTQGLPGKFKAFVGHKEACQELAEGATLLARSEECPIQMIRFRNNIYATQFHPELDNEGLSLRIRIYRNHGYFESDKAESLIDRIKGEKVTVPKMILKRFVDRYRK